MKTHTTWCVQDAKAAKKSMQLLVQKFLAEIIAYLLNHWSVSAQIENEMWTWSAHSSPVSAAQNGSPSKTHHSPSDPSIPLSYMRLSLPCPNSATHHTFSHFVTVIQLQPALTKQMFCMKQTEYSFIMFQILAEILNPVPQKSTFLIC